MVPSTPEAENRVEAKIDNNVIILRNVVPSTPEAEVRGLQFNVVWISDSSSKKTKVECKNKMLSSNPSVTQKN
jgi:hypothetical protein